MTASKLTLAALTALICCAAIDTASAGSRPAPRPSKPPPAAAPSGPITIVRDHRTAVVVRDHRKPLGCVGNVCRTYR